VCGSNAAGKLLNLRMPVDSDQDWEACRSAWQCLTSGLLNGLHFFFAAFGGLSRQETQGAYFKSTAGADADYSSSTSQTTRRGRLFVDLASRDARRRYPSLVQGGQMLQQPPHPRYAQSWNMLRDVRTGRTILLPENNNEPSQLRNDYIAASPLMPRRLFSDTTITHQHVGMTDSAFQFITGEALLLGGDRLAEAGFDRPRAFVVRSGRSWQSFNSQTGTST